MQYRGRGASWILQVLPLLLLSVFLDSERGYASEYWSESFEDYEIESGIKDQGGWDTWDGSESLNVNATVSDNVAAAGEKSLLVYGSNDVVYRFQHIYSGQWLVKAKVYLPNSQSGNLYFILLNNYNHGGPYNWSVQIKLSMDTGLAENLGGSIANGGGSCVIEPDTWHTISVQIDLDNNLHSVFIDDIPLHVDDTWAGGPDSLVSLAAIDLFSESSSESYFDDIAVYRICTSAVRNIHTGRTTLVAGVETPLYQEGTPLQASIKLRMLDCLLYTSPSPRD